MARKKSITGKQRAARKRNIKVARSAKKKGGGKKSPWGKDYKAMSRKVKAGVKKARSSGKDPMKMSVNQLMGGKAPSASRMAYLRKKYNF